MSSHHHTSHPFFTSPRFIATFSNTPVTPYHISLLLPKPLHVLSRTDFQATFLAIRHFVAQLTALPFPPPAGVERFGLAADGSDVIQLIPLHGIDPTADWKPILHLSDDQTGAQRTKTYLTTQHAPEATKEHLVHLMNTIRLASGLDQSDVSHHIDKSSSYHDDTNLFARLIRDEIPTYRFRESTTHLAFLTPFQDVVGSSVVIPRKHYTSDVLAMTDEQGGDDAFVSFVGAAWDVTRDLVEAFKSQGVEQCGVFMEGYHINWAHIKIMPVWPTLDGASAGSTTGVEGGSGDQGFEEFTEVYKGYLTTQRGPRVTNEQEQKLENTSRELQGRLMAL